MAHPRVLPASAGRSIERLRFHAEHTATPAQAEKCLRRESIWCRTWRFDDDTAAARWNDAWEHALAEDQIHPAFSRIAGKRIREPLVEGLASLVGSALLEDCLAGSPHPVALPGGSYRLTIRFELQRATAGGVGPMLLRLQGEVFGPDGEAYWSSRVVRTYEPHLIPVSLVYLWHSRHWEPTDERYESRSQPRS